MNKRNCLWMQKVNAHDLCTSGETATRWNCELGSRLYGSGRVRLRYGYDYPRIMRKAPGEKSERRGKIEELEGSNGFQPLTVSWRLFRSCTRSYVSNSSQTTNVYRVPFWRAVLSTILFVRVFKTGRKALRSWFW